MGDGFFDEAVRGALDPRGARNQQEKIDFVSFASFRGICSGNIKMIITNIVEPAHLLSYQLVLVRLAEKGWRTRSVLQRLAPAREGGKRSRERHGQCA